MYTEMPFYYEQDFFVETDAVPPEIREIRQRALSWYNQNNFQNAALEWESALTKTLTASKWRSCSNALRNTICFAAAPMTFGFSLIGMRFDGNVQQADLTYKLAKAYYYAGDYKKAIEYSNICLEKYPGWAGYYIRGWAYKALKQNTLAKQDFEQAIRLNPDFFPFCNEAIVAWEEEPLPEPTPDPTPKKPDLPPTISNCVTFHYAAKPAVTLPRPASPRPPDNLLQFNTSDPLPPLYDKKLPNVFVPMRKKESRSEYEQREAWESEIRLQSE